MDPLTIILVVVFVVIFLLLLAVCVYYQFFREERKAQLKIRTMDEVETLKARGKPNLEALFEAKKQKFKCHCASIVIQTLNETITKEQAERRINKFYRRILLVVHPDKIKGHIESGEYADDECSRVASHLANWAKSYMIAAKEAVLNWSLQGRSETDVINFIENSIEEFQCSSLGMSVSRALREEQFKKESRQLIRVIFENEHAELLRLEKSLSELERRDEEFNPAETFGS